MVCQNKQPDWADFSAEPPSGQLDPTNPESIKLVGTLLREQASWFPDRYMHVGGDEVNTNCYTREPHIASYLQEHGMNASQLIAGFAQQLHSIVRESNKRPITWEEAALEYNVPMANDTLVQVWTSAQHVEELVRRGLSVLTSPADAWYLDCGQGGWVTTPNGGNSWCDPFKTWQHVYRYDPLTNLTDIGYTQEHHPLVAGGEVTLWTEKTDRHNLDSKLWPRAAAAAETLWSGRRDAQGQERTTFAAFLRLHQLRRRLVRAGLRPDLLNMLWCEQNPDGCNLQSA